MSHRWIIAQWYRIAQRESTSIVKRKIIWRSLTRIILGILAQKVRRTIEVSLKGWSTMSLGEKRKSVLLKKRVEISESRRVRQSPGRRRRNSMNDCTIIRRRTSWWIVLSVQICLRIGLTQILFRTWRAKQLRRSLKLLRIEFKTFSNGIRRRMSSKRKNSWISENSKR